MARVTRLVLLCCLLAACKVGPDYRRPDVAAPVAARFQAAQPEDPRQDPVAFRARLTQRG